MVTDNTIVTTTDYAGAYIYENSSLKFISQAEGYIEPDGAGGYEYVYQYKDHLGNIRLSYSDSNNNGLVDNSEIMSEKNYYPFGLIQRGYNGLVQGTENNHKTYQGQEIHKEFDLNVIEFKYRFYDPAMGRFWSIDPLAEDYTYNATYAFSENKLGMGIELEGLEVYPNDLIFEVIRKGGDLINRFTGGAKNAIEASTGDVVRNRIAASNPEFDAEKARIDRVEKQSTGLGNMAESVSDAGHFALDVAGASQFPLVAEAADGLNAAWYSAEGDYTNAALSGVSLIPFGIGDAIGKGGKGLKFVFNVTAKEGDLMFLSTKVGDKTLELGGDFNIVDDVLTIKNFDVDGDLINDFGISNIKQAMSDLGEALGVKKVVTEGAPRTTGANPGKITKLTFNVLEEQK